MGKAKPEVDARTTEPGPASASIYGVARSASAGWVPCFGIVNPLDAAGQTSMYIQYSMRLDLVKFRG